MATMGCPLPANLNPLSPTGFRLNITKLPEVTFFCQEANIPDINLAPIPIGTPFSTNLIPGEIIDFGTLNVNFLVDESMSNYKAIYNWIVGLGFPRDYLQYQGLGESQEPVQLSVKFGTQQGNFSDGTLEILGSNNVGVQVINFKDLHPVSISSLNFRADVDDVQYLTGSAAFKYTYYEFVEPDVT